MDENCKRDKNSTRAFESFSHTNICTKTIPTVMCILHTIAYTGEFTTLTAATTHVPLTLSPQPVANIWLIEGVTFTLGPPLKMADDSSRNSSESLRHSDQEVSAYGNWPGLGNAMTVLESMYIWDYNIPPHKVLDSNSPSQHCYIRHSTFLL